MDVLEHDYDDYCSEEYYAHVTIGGNTVVRRVNDSLETIEPSEEEDCWIDLTSDPEDESREFEEPEVYEITSYEDGQRLDIGRAQHSKQFLRNQPSLGVSSKTDIPYLLGFFRISDSKTIWSKFWKNRKTS